MKYLIFYLNHYRNCVTSRRSGMPDMPKKRRWVKTNKKNWMIKALIRIIVEIYNKHDRGCHYISLSILHLIIILQIFRTNLKDLRYTDEHPILLLWLYKHDKTLAVITPWKYFNFVKICMFMEDTRIVSSSPLFLDHEQCWLKKTTVISSTIEVKSNMWIYINIIDGNDWRNEETFEYEQETIAD